MQNLAQGLTGHLPNLQRLCDSREHERRVREGREVDEADPGGERVMHVGGDPHRQAGLADATGTTEGQRAYVTQQPGQFSEISLAADEAIWFRWQVAAKESGGGRHRSSGG